MKLWGGRFEKETDLRVEAFTSSIHHDQHLWQADLMASMAHARMLGEQRILDDADVQELLRGLQGVFEDLQTGQLKIDFTAEDIHSFIETELGKRIGEPAKKLHTARSRNDQVATDLRLFLSLEVDKIQKLIREVQSQLIGLAENETDTLLPGMTHLQHAQPVSLAHHLLAYFWMLERDHERLDESLKRILTLPLGSAALAGTGFPIDRERTRSLLNFTRLCENSLDAVSDRDFVIEFLSQASLIMMHLSRFCEDLILWSTPAFGFVELGDEVTTGSSIMPQKKNPDVAELTRGKVGRVYGALMGALTMMKGLPLSYNRDLQEDKYHLIEALQTCGDSLQMTALMLQKVTWNRGRMQQALIRDFSNATDLADDLVAKGLSFRDAHEVIGKLVRNCLELGRGLEDLSLEELQKSNPLFDSISLGKIPHLQVMNARISRGGTAPVAVRAQLAKAQALLNRKET